MDDLRFFVVGLIVLVLTILAFRYDTIEPQKHPEFKPDSLPEWARKDPDVRFLAVNDRRFRQDILDAQDPRVQFRLRATARALRRKAEKRG